MNKMHVDRKLLKNIKHRTLKYLGHLLRESKYTLLQTILNGDRREKRIGRKKMFWLKNLTWSVFRRTDKIEIATRKLLKWQSSTLKSDTT